MRRTPLYYAAANGRLEACKLLLKSGARKNAVDRNGWTAVHAAARYGHVTILRWLEMINELCEKVLVLEVYLNFISCYRK